MGRLLAHTALPLLVWTHGCRGGSDLKKVNRRLEEENELLRELLLHQKREREQRVASASVPATAPATAPATGPATALQSAVTPPPEVAPVTKRATAASLQPSTQVQLDTFYRAVNSRPSIAPRAVSTAAASRGMQFRPFQPLPSPLDGNAAGFGSHAVVAPPQGPSPTGSVHSLPVRPSATSQKASAALALLARASQRSRAISHATAGVDPPLAPRAPTPSCSALGVAPPPLHVPQPAPALLYGRAVAAEHMKAAAATAHGQPAATASSPVEAWAQAQAPAADTSSANSSDGSECWESRESQLVGKFTSIITGLQDEIKRQAVRSCAAWGCVWLCVAVCGCMNARHRLTASCVSCRSSSKR